MYKVNTRTRGGAKAQGNSGMKGKGKLGLQEIGPSGASRRSDSGMWRKVRTCWRLLELLLDLAPVILPNTNEMEGSSTGVTFPWGHPHHLGACWWVSGSSIWAVVLDAVHGSARNTSAFS